ncbi:hypothetical protein [Pseudoduganella violacea]|uniref:Uncharacterized protein n=1 Tax=Pseudoduganella violacea TaxID=1715466 RepID=A0A7W5BFZ2_9BURK|nr:hypothetical protein [Pseudoduganella violacea]MBB3122487.1 hypothetical protein [Pseudoduganella violacea]
MQPKKNWKREVAEYILAFIIVIAFTFMLSALAAVLDDPAKGFKSSEAASWVQAIGSIAAIFGAFMFGERQARHAHNTAVAMQDRDRAGKSAAVLAICSAASSNVALIERIFCIRPYDGLRRLAEFQKSSTEHIIRALQAIPVHEVGSARAVTALLSTIDNLQWLLIHIEAFDAELSNSELPDSAEYRQELARGDIGRTVESVQSDYKLLEEELSATKVDGPMGRGQ